jgi:hypothetical protein
LEELRRCLEDVVKFDFDSGKRYGGMDTCLEIPISGIPLVGIHTTQTAIPSPMPKAAASPGTSRTGWCRPSFPGSNGGTTTFRYDPFGRRIQKSGPLGTRNYLYEGANVIEEVDGAGSVLARYAHGPRVDQPLSQSRSGVVSYHNSTGLVP